MCILVEKMENEETSSVSVSFAFSVAFSDIFHFGILSDRAIVFQKTASTCKVLVQSLDFSFSLCLSLN